MLLKKRFVASHFANIFATNFLVMLLVVSIILSQFLKAFASNNDEVQVFGHKDLKKGQVEIIGKLWNTSLTLQRDSRAFAADYTETIIRAGEVRHKRRRNRNYCHYSGWSNTGERVFASNCGKGFRAIIGTPGQSRKVREIRYLAKEAKHIVVEDSGLPIEGSDFVPRTSIYNEIEKRRKLRSDECSSEDGDWTENYRATKFMSVIVFNDAARVASVGLEEAAETTAIAFAAIYDIYASISSGVLDDDITYGGLKGDGSIFGCDMRILLTGQISYEDTNPDEFEYAIGTEACNTCCIQLGSCGQTCTETEISSFCLLASVGNFAYQVRDELIAISTTTSDFDIVVLISGTDFDSSTQGLAYIGGSCRGDSAVAVVSTYSTSTATRLATVTAHEIGHLLGMEHDAITDDINSNIMAPSFRGGLDPLNLAFSDDSRQYAADWFSTFYGQSNSVPACLDDVVQSMDDEPVITTCGDGIVQENEQCDPGIGIDDDCCSNDCTLEPGCECALSEACCTDQGTIANFGKVCRDRMHETCDLYEVCDGQSATCPLDLFAVTGTECVSDVSGLDGVCYKGNCFAESDTCYGVTLDGNSAEIVCRASTCSNIGCRESSGSICTVIGTAPDGTPCDDDKICVSKAFELTLGLVDDDASECVSYDEARFFHWVVSETDPCLEEPKCQDETGELTDTENCDPDTIPQLPGYCTSEPTVSPAPTATAVPTHRPTLFPTSMPTITPIPTLVPTTPFEDDDKDNSTAKSIFRAFQKLSFMHKIALVVVVVFFFSCCCVLCGWRRTHNDEKYQQASLQPPVNTVQRPSDQRSRGSGSNPQPPSSRRPNAVSRTHQFSPVEQNRTSAAAQNRFVDDEDYGPQAQMVPPRAARNRPPPPDYSPPNAAANANNYDGGYSLHSAYSV